MLGVTGLGSLFPFRLVSLLVFRRFNDVGGGRFRGVGRVLFEFGDARFESPVFFESGFQKGFEFGDSFIFGIHERHNTLLTRLIKEQFRKKSGKDVNGYENCWGNSNHFWKNPDFAILVKPQ
jgi:hypothetical protein